MMVLGADTRKRSHTIAAVAAATGEVAGEKTVAVSSRGFGAGETSLARAMSWSVVLPIAETVPTTFRPLRLASTNRRATCRILTGSATDEPPNFITTVSNDAIR